MSTLIKVTYLTNGRGTIVNFDKVESIYKVFDRNNGKMQTRINFDGERFLMVQEEPQEILKLVQEYERGEFQDTDWVDIEIPNMEEKLENSFNDFGMRSNYGRNQSQQPYNNNRRNYNNNYNNRY
jgi:uncharacterized protein YlzI (FlbEa/FlbD family)